MERQDELLIAVVTEPSNTQDPSQTGARCVNGHTMRPEPPRDDSPSTACNSSAVTASGGVRLGRADPPCLALQELPKFHQRSQHLLHPPPSNCSCSPRQWKAPANPEAPTRGPPDIMATEAVAQQEEIQTIQPAVRPVEAEVWGTVQQEEEEEEEEEEEKEESRQEEDCPIHQEAVPIRHHRHLHPTPRLSRQEDQDSPVGTQELQQYLHHLLHLNVQLMRGHHLTGLESLYQSYPNGSFEPIFGLEPKSGSEAVSGLRLFK